MLITVFFFFFYQIKKMFSSFFSQAESKKAKARKLRELKREAEIEKAEEEEEDAKRSNESGDEGEAKSGKKQKKQPAAKTLKRKRVVDGLVNEEIEIVKPKKAKKDASSKAKKVSAEAKSSEITSAQVKAFWKRLVSGKENGKGGDDDNVGIGSDSDDDGLVEATYTSDDCKVFVGGIRASVDVIKGVFSEYGEIKEVLIPKPKTGEKPSAAFIEYASPSQAQTAAKKGNGRMFSGKKLRVELVAKNKLKQQEEQVPKDARVLFVKNLAFNVTEKDIMKNFGKCGKIVTINLPKFKDTERPKGIAFIEFETHKGLLAGLAKDRIKINGRVILCSASEHSKIKKLEEKLVKK